MVVEPIPDAPAAMVTLADEQALVVADYHAGIEAVLRSEGVEIDSRDPERLEQLQMLIEECEPDRLIILGDLVHTIGTPWQVERAELETIFEAISVPVTLVKGNHDGEIEGVLEAFDDVTVTDSTGFRAGNVGFVHGHTWPSEAVISAEYVCVGHEHPVVRLTDEVGGRRIERVWLRGDIDPDPFESRLEDPPVIDGTLVVFPAFNDLSGGTWVNVPDQEFLAPFLPAGLRNGEAYLLDGTRLGPYAEL